MLTIARKAQRPFGPRLYAPLAYVHKATHRQTFPRPWRRYSVLPGIKSRSTFQHQPPANICGITRSPASRIDGRFRYPPMSNPAATRSVRIKREGGTRKARLATTE
ncbi:hypothetical protein KCP73_05935 [Salmonella enterica subsp. enterica]|nr:hypothetical protein KCP73_05935 [Salmonella enterica subsp. enterica]